MRLVTAALVAAGLALAGCASQPPSTDAQGAEGAAADDVTAAGEGGFPPAPRLEFAPDMDALSRGFCDTLAFTLPSPLFGELRFEGREDRLTDGPLPCEVWGDPSATQQERANASVSIEVTRVLRGEQEFPLDRNNLSFAGFLFGQGSVYGHVAFLAPEGPWGEAGPYELEYGSAYDGDGAVRGTLAEVRVTPKGYHA